MKSATLKDLKEDLSHWTEEAANGETVAVTRYNRPYILLIPYTAPGLHRGKEVGKGLLHSVLREGVRGKWLDLLAEDRNEK